MELKDLAALVERPAQTLTDCAGALEWMARGMRLIADATSEDETAKGIDIFSVACQAVCEPVRIAGGMYLSMAIIGVPASPGWGGQ